MPAKKTREQFIREAVAKHGNKYDYSLVNYIGAQVKVKIICDVHGKFEQIPMDHLKGRGCADCGKLCSSLSRRKQGSSFKEEATRVHNGKYDYSLVDYINTTTKVKIICPTHGVFEQLPMNHLKLVGCPRCKISKGETKIIQWLETSNIRYVREYRVPELGQRRFDFFLPDYNTFVEFDGIQHFHAYDKFGGYEGLKLCKESDLVKTQYCESNNINLIRIPYWKIKQIPNILEGIGT